MLEQAAKDGISQFLIGIGGSVEHVEEKLGGTAEIMMPSCKNGY